MQGRQNSRSKPPPTDRIRIRGLRLRCSIGVSPQERRHPQNLRADLLLYLDLSKAAATDRLKDSVDYRGIVAALTRLAEGASFRLLEALAEAAARVCLEPEAVQAVEVRLEKPNALLAARSAGVEIFRRREAARGAGKRRVSG